LFDTALAQINEWAPQPPNTPPGLGVICTLVETNLDVEFAWSGQPVRIFRIICPFDCFRTYVVVVIFALCEKPYCCYVVSPIIIYGWENHRLFCIFFIVLPSYGSN
jgi:hypothetical protein